MSIVPENPQPIAAGWMVDMLAAACEQCQVGAEGLLDWSVSKEQVAVLLSDGRKVKFMVTAAAGARAIGVTNGAGLVSDPAHPGAAGVTNGPELVTPGGGIRAGHVTNGPELVTPGGGDVGVDGTKDIPMSEAVAVMHRIAGRPAGRAKK